MPSPAAIAFKLEHVRGENRPRGASCTETDGRSELKSGQETALDELHCPKKPNNGRQTIRCMAFGLRIDHLT